MKTIVARHPQLGRTARTALVTTVCAVCAVPFAAQGQIAETFTLGDLTYSEFFDSMGTSAVYPAGWTGVRAGGTGAIGATLTPVVDAGTSTAGGIHNYGTAADDRALGTLASGATIPNFGTSFVNNTGGFISGISMTGVMEQWRTGNNLTLETVFFEFSFDADSLLNTTTLGATATWIPLSTMDLVEKINGTTGGALDGNLADNRTALTTGASPVSVAWGNGTAMWIRWRDTDNTGSDAGLAIDEFTLTVTPGTAPKNILWSPSSNAWDQATPNWKEGATVTTFAPGDNVTFNDTGLAFNDVVIAGGGVTPGTMVVDTTGTYTFTGGTITTLSPIQKNGPGTLVLGAPTTTGVTVNAGTFRTAASEVLGNSSTVVAANGTTVDFNNNNETIATMSLTGATVSTGTGLLTATGNYTVNTSPTDTATTISGRIATGTTTHKVTVADSPGATEDLVLNASLEGAGRLDFDFVSDAMNATVRIAGDNSLHSGGLQLDSNLIYVIAHANAFGTGQLFLNGGTFHAAVPLTGANALAIPVSAGGNGVTFEGSNIDFSGLITFFGGGVKTYTVAAGQTVTFSGSLNSGTGPSAPNSAITKQGAGTLVFAEDGSAYTGAVTVNGGTIVAATATALGSGPITLEASSPDTAILAATTSTSIGALNGGFGDGVKVLLGQTAPSAEPVVLTINTSGSGDYSGPIETVPGRTSALVKAGSGTQRLAGVNSYTGTTTVSGGTLQFGKKVSLYNNVTSNWTAANINVASGATLAFNVGGTDEFTAADIQSLAALGTATGGFADGAILGLDTTNADGGTFTYGSVIADTNGGANDLGLTKLGFGTLILTQVNTYTGPTSVLGGELVFTQSDQLTSLNIGDGAVVTLSSAGPAPGAAFEAPAGEEVGAPLQAVPEPGAVSLLIAGMLGVLTRRRR